MEKKLITLKNQETYAYLEKGHGDKYLILVHGNFSSGIYYKPLIDRLPENIHVFAPDLRGFGDSSYEKRVSSLKELADDLVMFMDNLKIEKADIAGWSLGGGVVMEFAAHYPERVNKLILINSTTHKGYPVFKKDANNQMKLGEAYSSKEEMAEDPVQVKPLLMALEAKNLPFIKYIYDLTIYTYNKPSDEDNMLYLTDSLKQRNLVDVDWALANLNMGKDFNFYQKGQNTISLIKAPVLHIWGSHDKTVPEFMILDNIKALEDQSTYVKFDQCGHSPLVDKPDELTKVILDFIR
ncbi:MAG: alpha/beta hydrolase [Candidatus Izemoplasmatales bacterium]|jgi:pimeloyl-ACP methyl ester carboxylesterase|nr:alpha/beta hydrolase [Candidatus Izemoplasmatales bacterium]